MNKYNAYVFLYICLFVSVCLHVCVCMCERCVYDAYCSFMMYIYISMTLSYDFVSAFYQYFSLHFIYCLYFNIWRRHCPHRQLCSCRCCSQLAPVPRCIRFVFLVLVCCCCVLLLLQLLFVLYFLVALHLVYGCLNDCTGCNIMVSRYRQSSGLHWYSANWNGQQN